VRKALRAGLTVLAAVQLVLGGWTLLFPASFYADVPTVDLTPPFSEHLFRDFGGATLGLALVLGSAAVTLEKRLVTVALLAYLAFSGPHLLFHLGQLSGASGTEAFVLVGSLFGSVVLPVVLLIAVGRAGAGRTGLLLTGAGTEADATTVRRRPRSAPPT
jgi:hypothetical protein